MRDIRLSRRLCLTTIGVVMALQACSDRDSADRADSETAAASSAPQQALWTAPAELPLVPAGATVLPDGRVLMWSAANRFGAAGTGTGRTVTAKLDPTTGAVEEHVVAETEHDMAWGGASRLADGRLMIDGGVSATRASLFDPFQDTWDVAGLLKAGRGGNSSVALPDGSVLTLGGSWTGDGGIQRIAEVWRNGAGWRPLTGIRPARLATGDTNSARADNRMWLFPIGRGRILQAGPSAQMHWLDLRGDGSISTAGPRGDDLDSANGSAVMIDADTILKTGGALTYEGSGATVASYLIKVGAGDSLTVRKLPPMNFARTFHNGVVLPNGQVVIVGGQALGQSASDRRAVLEPELWDPTTRAFSPLPPLAVPRTAGSVALLLADGRVLIAGGGFCGIGCQANHSDFQIMTPPYLLNADGTRAARPELESVPKEARLGSTFEVRTKGPVAAFDLVRMSANTQGLNNDQRRLPVSFESKNDTTYRLSLPSNPGVALPGLYMLFARDAHGVPSVARILSLNAQGLPAFEWPGPQASTAGVPERFMLRTASTGSVKAATYSASGLPPGMQIDPASGAFSGTPRTPGRYEVSMTARTAEGAQSIDFPWTIDAAETGPTPGPVRFVKLEATKEVFGNPWASMAEFNLLDKKRHAIDRSGWQVASDSAESLVGDGLAANAIDGNPATFWHTQYSGNSPPPPHWFVVDLGRGVSLGGFRYLPRPGGSNGTIGEFVFSVSPDGVKWSPVAHGALADRSEPMADKTIFFDSDASPAEVLGDAGRK